jgi:hypothetical protein
MRRTETSRKHVLVAVERYRTTNLERYEEQSVTTDANTAFKKS